MTQMKRLELNLAGITQFSKSGWAKWWERSTVWPLERHWESECRRFGSGNIGQGELELRFRVAQSSDASCRCCRKSRHRRNQSSTDDDQRNFHHWNHSLVFQSRNWKSFPKQIRRMPGNECLPTKRFQVRLFQAVARSNLSAERNGTSAYRHHSQ